MTFNLITARWLPCCRASGARDWIAPHEITSAFEADPILALDFPRPDWNAAVTELLIGLMSATIPPKDPDLWADFWLAPPPPETLEAALAPLAFAFDFDGDGPRCFQDFESLPDGKIELIEALLLDRPADDNRDLFTKAGAVSGLSGPFAAAAAVTLQTYAAGGGRGHMANPRKKGPLTVLLAPYRRVGKQPMATLWDVIWANVLPLNEDDGALSSVLESHPDSVFPWLRPPKPIAVVTDEKVPSYGRFFSQPRRIRLNWDEVGSCSLGGKQGPFCSTIRTRPKGHQYGPWRHPLSSYHTVADGNRKCVSAPEVRTYEFWLGAWGLENEQDPPLALRLWDDRLGALSELGPGTEKIDMVLSRQKGLAAWGVVADRKREAKVLGWVDERIPYFEPKANSPRWAEHFRDAVTFLVGGAKTAADALKYELRRNAWAKWDGKQFKLPDNVPKDAFDEVAAQLWAETQEAFVACLAALHAGDPNDPDRSLRDGFRQQLRGIALRLFDETAGTDTLAEQNARRLIEARKGLVIALSREGKVASALGIA